MSDNLDLVEKNGLNMAAMGGTELMYRGLYERLPRELLEKFQIFPSRINVPLDESKVRLLWCHDLAGDPMTDHLRNGGWKKFHKLIFVSNWQMQSFIRFYNIPWSHCMVLQNCIESFSGEKKSFVDPFIRLAYWSTPQRGLHILIPVFEKLLETHDNIELYVHSSFGLYGQNDRDEQFKGLFKNNDKIHYEAPLSNEELRKKINDYHVLVYPCIWEETSCRVLMEAMSAGMLAVIPNLGALPETAANFSNMYQWHEDVNHHASIFYSALDATLKSVESEQIKKRLQLQKLYADIYYTWPKRILEWTALLTSLQNEPTKIEEPKEFFEYKVGG